MADDEKRGDELIGQLVEGRYRVVRLLGEGGMGAVYEVEHVKFGRRLALKRLHDQYAKEESIVARFHREAKAATMAGNKHIVEVTDMGELPDGAPYIVLEYLEGQDLDGLLRSEGPLPIHRAANLIRQVCDGLGAAHAQGIVHRDLKPENLFLVDDGDEPDFVKILDFGVSKVKENAEADKTSLTVTGMALGTPVYMSVEQAHGFKDIDHRADIYALGVILYKLLTGQPPFQGQTYAALMVEILTEDPPPLSSIRKEIPHGLEAVVLRAMSREREDRYGSVIELSEALAPYDSMAGATDSKWQDATVPAPSGESPDGPSPTATGPALSKEAGTAIERPRRKGTPTKAAKPGADHREKSEDSSQGGDDLETATAVAIPAAQPRPQSPTTEPTPPPVALTGKGTEPATKTGGMERKVVLGAVLGAVALALLGAVSFGFFGGQGVSGAGGTVVLPPGPPLPLPIPTPLASRGAEAGPERDRPAEVRIRVKAEPASAKLFIDGREYPNPMDARQPRSLDPVKIRIAAEGFEPLEDIAIFDSDRSFEFALDPLPAEATTKAPGSVRPPAPPRQGTKTVTPAAPPRETSPAKVETPSAPPEAPVYSGPSGKIRDTF